MNTKVCTNPKCGKELPATLEYFYKSKTGKFGVVAECRKCYNKRQKERSTPPNTDVSIKQVCTGICGRELPATLEYFHRNKKNEFGVQTECKQCCNKRQKEVNNLANEDVNIKKTCNDCGKELPATTEFFYRSKRGKFGVKTECKQCCSKKQKEINNPPNEDSKIKQTCTGKCGKEKPATLEYFYRDKGGRSGVTTKCKECCSKIQKETNNPPNEDSNIKQTCTGGCGEELPATLEYFHRLKSGKFGVKCQCKECCKQWKKNNRDKRNEYVKNKYHNNEQYRIRTLLSSNLRHALNNIGESKNASILKYIGCDIAFLQQHLNNTKDDNWGDVELDIDHIIPVSLYDHTNKEEIKKCWNWRNLRYLPGPENSSKGNILDITLVEKYGISDLLPDFKRKICQI